MVAQGLAMGAVIGISALPTRSYKADRVHEIKHDGYRLIFRRDGDRSFVSRMKASSAYPAARRPTKPWSSATALTNFVGGAWAVSAAQ
jgi:hypothetical protein